MKKRHESRADAVCLLYEYAFSGGNENEINEMLSLGEENRDVTYDEYTRALVMGVVNHLYEIDQRIGAAAENWRLERIARVPLAVLRVCTYELMYGGIPTEIAINEALELTRAYDDEKAVPFVNGIMGRIVRTEKGENDGAQNSEKDGTEASAPEETGV